MFRTLQGAAPGVPGSPLYAARRRPGASPGASQAPGPQQQASSADPAPLGSPLATAPIQRGRKPKKKKYYVRKHRAGAHYSERDPFTFHPSEKAAMAYERLLEKRGLPRLSLRTPTMYTYMHTKSHCKIGTTCQGPHTYAHRGTLARVQGAKTIQDVKDAFSEHVADPNEVKDMLQTEGTGSYTGDRQKRVKRYRGDYKHHYLALHDELYLKKKPSLIVARHHLNTLLNMDPYATYGWKSTTKASKKATAGKGENVVNPTFDDLHDAPKSGTFDSVQYDLFKEDRQDMFQHFPPP